jgi:hypothetical protein
MNSPLVQPTVARVRVSATPSRSLAPSGTFVGAAGKSQCARVCARCVVGAAGLSTEGRALLQSQRLRRFLGERPGHTAIRKPLFMHRRTYGALLRRLGQIEAKPESRKYKSKRLTERTLKPNHMYRSSWQR